MNRLTLLLVLTAAGLLMLLLQLVLKDPRPSTMPSGSERGALIKDLNPKFLSVWSKLDGSDKRIIELAASVLQKDEENCVVKEAKTRAIALLPSKQSDIPPALGASAQVADVWTCVGTDPALFDAHRIAIPDDVTKKAAEITARGHTALMVGTEKNEFGVIEEANAIQLVNSITLKKGNVSIQLVRKDKEWVMPEQKNRTAKDDRISKFLKDVETAYSTGPRSAKDLAKFELSPSTRTEVVLDGPGGKTTIYVGKNLNESGSFVQRDINAPVLEIDKYLPSAMGIREEKSVTVLDPAFFYDLKIFGDSQDDAIEVAIKKGNEVTVLQKVIPGKGSVQPNQKIEEKEKPIWWMTEPEGAAADEGKVRNICSTVLNLTGKGYADDIPEKDRGLDKPSGKIVIKLKNGEKRTLTFGKIENDDVVVSAEGKADAFKVAKYVYDTCTKTDELKQKEEKKEGAEKPAEKSVIPIPPPSPAPNPVKKAVPNIPAPK